MDVDLDLDVDGDVDVDVDVLEHCGTCPRGWEVTGHIEENSSETCRASCLTFSCYTRIYTRFLDSYLLFFFVSLILC